MPLRVTPLKKFTAHQDWITSIAFSPDGCHLATASADNTVRIWFDVLVKTGTPECFTRQLTHPDWIYSVAWCPCGRYILSGSQDMKTRMWDVESGEIVLQPPPVHSASIRTVAFSPDEKYYASGAADSTVCVMNSTTGAIVFGPLMGRQRNSWITAIAFSPDGQKIVSCSSERTICVWDVTPGSGGTIIHELFNAHTDWISSVSFHASGDFFVTGSKDRTIRIWALRTGQQALADIHGGGSTCNSLSQVLSSNGFHVHRNEVKSVQFANYGNTILTASSDNSMRLVDATNGSFLTKQIVGHKEAVWSAKFSPNNQFIASASQDGQVILWSITRS
jgi:WD40 repeat protein